MENFQIAEDALKASQESAGSAMRENEKYVQSIAGRIEQFKSAFQSLSSTIVSSDLIKTVVSAGTIIISIIDKIISSAGPLIAIISTMYGLKKIGINDLFSESNISRFTESLTKAKTVIVDLVVKAKNAGSAMVVLKQTGSTAGAALNSAFGPVSLTIGAITLAVTLLTGAYNYLSNASDRAADKHEELSQKYKETADNVKTLEKSIKSTSDRIAELEGIKVRSDAEDSELGKLREEIQLLELKLQLEREQLEIDREKKVNAARDTLTSKDLVSEHKKYSVGTQSQYALSFSMKSPIERGSEIVSEINEINKAMLESAKIANDSNVSKNERERHKNVIKDLESKRTRLSSELLEIKEKILPAYEDLKNATNLTESDKALLKLVEGIVSTPIGTSGTAAQKPADGGAPFGISQADIELLNSGIDSVQGRISSLSGSLASLRDGSLGIEDVIDLMQDFPELAPYVDLTADGFGDLESALENLIRQSPNKLIDQLKDLKETGKYTEEQKSAIDGMCDALENLSTDAIKDASGEFGVLADAINGATKAKHDLDVALQEEDYDAGYARRVSAFSEFEDIIAAGEFGSKAYAAYREYFGLVGETSDQIRIWMDNNKKYFSEGTDGIDEFLKKVDSMDGVGGKLENIASYNSETGEFRYDINRLSEFADALDWSEEMLQDFISKYRMRVEEWTSRTAEMTQTELYDKELLTDFGGSTFANLDELQSLMNTSADGVKNLVNEINVLREQQGLGEIQIVGLDQVTITQQMVDALHNVKGSADEVRNTIVELSNTDGIQFEAGITFEGQTIDEIINSTRSDSEEVTVAFNMTVNDEELIAEVTATKGEIEAILGDGWEAILTGDTTDATQKAEALRKLIEGINSEKVTATVNGNTLAAQDALDAIIARLNTISQNSSKVIDITYRYNTIGTPPAQHAKGTKHAKKGYALLGDEYSPTGTPKPELVLTERTAYVAGLNGPELGYLNDGDVVFNARDTRKILGKKAAETGMFPRFASGRGLIGSLVDSVKNAVNNIVNKFKKPKPEPPKQSSKPASSTTAKKSNSGNIFGSLNTNTSIYNPKPPSYSSSQAMKDTIDEVSAKPSAIMTSKNSWAGGTQSKPSSSSKPSGSGNGGGGSGGSGGSNGSCSSNEKKESEFERQYKEHQHLLKMEKEKYADYIKWLEKAYQEAYAKGEIELDDYRKYAEEVFEGQKELFQDQLNDIEHQISALEREKGNDNKIINMYLGMIESIKKEIQAAKDRGLNENDDWIQELQGQLHDYEDAIKDIQDEIKENAEDSVKDLIDYRIDMIKKELEEERDALKDKLGDLKDFYNKQKEMLQDAYDEEKKIEQRNEKQKKKSDLEAELAQLEFDDSAWAEKRRLELKEQLAAANKDLEDFEKDNALEDAKDLLDKMYDKQEEQINKQIEAIEEKLNDPKMLYNQALKDIQNNTKDLFLEMVKYNDKYGSGNSEDITNMWNESKESLDRFLEVFGKAYKDIIMVSPPTGGYASGTRNATRGVHRVDERGPEWVFTSGDGNKYRIFSGGEKVLDAAGTNFLYNFANSGGRSMISAMSGFGDSVKRPRVKDDQKSVVINAGDILIQGNADSRTVSEIRRAQREGIDYILKEFTHLSK